MGDLNGEGFTDILVGQEAEQTSAEVFLGNGDGTFGTAKLVPALGVTTAGGILIADLNQDGRPDIAGAPSGVGDGGLVAMINVGDGGFQTSFLAIPTNGQIVALPAGKGPHNLVVSNFNTPRDLGSLATGTIQVLVNSGNGTFTLGQSYLAPGGAILAVADFNGDCIPDIATSNSFPETTQASGLSVLYGDGSGEFIAPVSLDDEGLFPFGLAAMGSADNPQALAVSYLVGGVTIYGDANPP